MSKTLNLAEELIRKKSVTPNDEGCQKVISERLNALNFKCELFNSKNVQNLWAVRGDKKPIFVFAGHTDVVPSGPIDKWFFNPYTPTKKNGKLYGRGTADMKSSLSAMVVATEEFVYSYPNHKGSIAFLLTSDEEGPATDGTVIICNALKSRGIELDYCIVGEPTSVDKLGDTIKNGRRGSLSGRLVFKGVQGHIAYPHLARNPIHLALNSLLDLSMKKWDEGNKFYLPTSFQMSNINSGTGATNIIPNECIVDFNFRFSSSNTVENLKKTVTEIIGKYTSEFNITWSISGYPFFTPVGDLSNAMKDSIKSETGTIAELSTSGGTSDGRFISKICNQIIEFGPINSSIHKINENINIKDIDSLKNIYFKTLKKLML